ncbi:DUF6153 family protein [Nocardia sp. NBC_01499]|uniref:DUF6153 family protein n=1 Tax=Nocardia sp. NBC_01499 TaxID=2903597 RepID=UPI00386E7DC7
MVEQHLPLRATGLARALGLLVLLAGIVAMHSAVFAMHGHAAASDHGAMARAGGTVRMPVVSTGTNPMTMPVGHGIDADTTAQLPMATGITAALPDHGAPDQDCAGDGCGGRHGAMHGCVFILAAATLLFALVLLYRMTVDRPGNGVARLRHRRPQRERSPPWTVLSLAELSILRI